MKVVGLENRSIALEKYPCVHAAYYANYECEHHPNLLECPDVLLYYDGEGYALPVRDGGPSVVYIKYCPWCATKL
ncbi:DUF6980 family protein [Mangrovimicrobium sediminis]|uniref:DUF6980 family protein n=1 Tax=Mangrovimicrobium sediminis TaxID=2562682 RepID=UPI003EC063B8